MIGIEWKPIRNQIDVAFIVAGTDFVKVAKRATAS